MRFSGRLPTSLSAGHPHTVWTTDAKRLDRAGSSAYGRLEVSFQRASAGSAFRRACRFPQGDLHVPARGTVKRDRDGKNGRGRGRHVERRSCMRPRCRCFFLPPRPRVGLERSRYGNVGLVVRRAHAAGQAVPSKGARTDCRGAGTSTWSGMRTQACTEFGQPPQSSDPGVDVNGATCRSRKRQ